MKNLDDELVKGCQQYLDTLKNRSEVVERQKAEQRQAEEQKRVKREQWRKLLYETEGQGLTFIVPNKKDSE